MFLMNLVSVFILGIIINSLTLLKNLRDIGNTVLVVEHDPEMMKAADILIDMGPKAGKQGGEIIAKGTFDEVANNPNSLTGKYLSGIKFIPVPEKRNTKRTRVINIIGASENNLKNIDVSIPMNKFVCINRSKRFR